MPHAGALPHLPAGDTTGPVLAKIPHLGTKRLFSNRSSTAQAYVQGVGNPQNDDGIVQPPDLDTSSRSDPQPGGHLDKYLDAEDIRELHHKKRNRTSDWPLKSNISCNARLMPRPTLQTRNKHTSSPSSCQQLSPQPRPSKFLEGSMKDRASQKPDLLYTGDLEGHLHRFDIEQSTHGNDRLGGMEHAKGYTALSLPSEKIETPRPSSIYRFGKTIASAFHPSSWKIWSKPQDEGVGLEMSRGYHVDDNKKTSLERDRIPRNRNAKEMAHADAHVEHNKHDSGIEIDHHIPLENLEREVITKSLGSSLEYRRYGRVFLDASDISHLSHDDFIAAETPLSLSQPSNGQRKSSLPNIHGGYGKNKSSSEPIDSINSPRGLRRLPSRKDLQKQQKLVKRVSDLEGRLEAARRQLAEALGEPIPAQTSGISRSRFTPGVLASLPSERMLNAHTLGDHNLSDFDASVEIGSALTTDQQKLPHLAKGRKNLNDGNRHGTDCAVWKEHDNPLDETTLKKSAIFWENSEHQPIDPTMEGSPRSQHLSDLPQEETLNLQTIRRMLKKRKSNHIGSAAADGRYTQYAEPEESDDSTGPERPIMNGNMGHLGGPQKVHPTSKLCKIGRGTANTKTRAIELVTEKEGVHPTHVCTPHSSTTKPESLSKEEILAPSSFYTEGRGVQSPSVTICRIPEASLGKNTLRVGDSHAAVGTVPLDLSFGNGMASREIKSGLTTAQNVQTSREEEDSSVGKVKDKLPFEWPEDVF